jgi:ferredoxin-NADP reductase
MNARLVNVREIASGTAGFEIEVDGSLSFEAGQTCDLTLPSPAFHDEHGTARTFSIASSPADLPRLMFATRISASAFKRSLMASAPGTALDVDGPYGSFTLHRNAAKPAVFFAGGIGITPFRSIIKDATERKLPHAVTLFYSNRTPDSTAFLPDLEGWAQQNPRLSLVPTITDDVDIHTWKYQKGMIDAAFLNGKIQPDARAIYYIAGPPPFVTAMRGALEQLGADPDDIRTEEFAGY